MREWAYLPLYTRCQLIRSYCLMSAMIDLIDLPNPQPLLPSLLQAGFSHGIATAASRLYQQRAEEFKRRTELILVAAWQKMATLPRTSVSSLDPLTRKDVSNFTEVYVRYLEEWKEEMIQLLERASLKAPPKAATSRNSFNYVGTLIDSSISTKIFHRSIYRYWSTSSTRIHFRHTQTKSFLPGSQICSIGKFMYG